MCKFVCNFLLHLIHHSSLEIRHIYSIFSVLYVQIIDDISKNKKTTHRFANGEYFRELAASYEILMNLLCHALDVFMTYAHSSDCWYLKITKYLSLLHLFYQLGLPVWSTVKHVNKGHPRETQNMVFIDKLSLGYFVLFLSRNGFWSVTFICSMVFIRRWSLIQIWLFNINHYIFATGLLFVIWVKEYKGCALLIPKIFFLVYLPHRLLITVFISNSLMTNYRLYRTFLCVDF